MNYNYTKNETCYTLLEKKTNMFDKKTVSIEWGGKVCSFFKHAQRSLRSCHLPAAVPRLCADGWPAGRGGRSASSQQGGRPYSFLDARCSLLAARSAAVQYGSRWREWSDRWWGA